MIPAQVIDILASLRARLNGRDAASRLASRAAAPAFRLPATRASASAIAKQWESYADAPEGVRERLADAETLASAEAYSGNIENMIGVARTPIGVAGPLRVNGLHASGDYRIPLATTEAALVASFCRGAEAITQAGGAAAALLSEGVLRAPAFVFPSVLEAGLFVEWVAANVELLKCAAESTTSHGRLISMEPRIDADIVFLLCRYKTGEAAGQNMVTVATQALCEAAVAQCPIHPLRWYVEANFSGDKKGSYLGLIAGRGRKATASVTLPGSVVTGRLKTTVEDILAYSRVAQVGALLSGQIGAQAHYANGLAALYLATGQDIACVAESAVGFTRVEPRGDGLFVSVTLPNLIVGTVGGGAGLPTPSACLAMLGLKGSGSAAALAEIAATLCLAGEISLISAIAGQRFTRAHALLRKKS